MHVVIVGNGAAGVAAALRLRRNDPHCRITMISGESTYHYSRPALMYIYMGHMRYRDTRPYPDSLWQEQRIELVRDWVTHIDVDTRQLELYRGEGMSWDRLLLATGSTPNRFGWPGQDLHGVQGLWGLPDLHKLERNTVGVKRAVVVGGGLIGIELAEMLHFQGIHVTFLVRESSYWNRVLPPEESTMVNEVIRASGMDLRLDTELKEILDDGRGHVRAVRTHLGEEIPCGVVGLTTGVSPNIDVVRESGIPTARGILVDGMLRSPVEDVFAAGDCAEIVTQNGKAGLVQQVWYTARMQGEIAGDVLAGIDRSYTPPLWYNSAKFLDLEYQVYGQVHLEPEKEHHVFWKHPDRNRILRLVHNRDQHVIGVQAMGMRLRQRVCESWILQKKTISEVLEELHRASFDPEFTARPVDAIRRAMMEMKA